MSSNVAVSFLGPLGTYSHQATSDFFGSEVELLPVARIADVFASVESGESSYGLVPIENSSIGAVAETSDALRTTQLVVRGMTGLKIGHALLGPASHDKERRELIKRVYSHEQGIGQCVGYLGRYYPSAEVVPVNSTAAAAIAVNDDNEPALAICSPKCAEVYGLSVVDTNIQDGGQANTTRFVIIAQPQTVLPASYPVPTHQFISTAPTPVGPLSPVPTGDAKRKQPQEEERAAIGPAAKAAKVDEGEITPTA